MLFELISIAVNVPVIKRSVLWKYGWLLTNRGQLRWIDDWIIQLRRNKYHWWWKIDAIWMTVLAIKHRLSRGVPRCLTWLFPVPLLWKRPIPFGCDMMNAIWVCGGVVYLLFCLLMSIKMREPIFGGENCSHIWVSVIGIILITSFLSQYNSNQALKYDLSEKGH